MIVWSTIDEKTKYFKQKDAWKAEGKIKAVPKKENNDNKEEGFRKRIVKEVYTEVVGAVEQSTAASDSSPAEKSVSDDIRNKILRTLKSKIKVARTKSVSFSNVKSAVQLDSANVICDSGADTTLLGSSFLIIGHTERMANVSGFDEEMTVENLKIGSGVAAFDKPDGTTVLVLCHEAIDYTSQPHTMLSTNQLRHHGVDVCDVHPKFATGGRKGLFRIKVGEHELPFKMENGLATLTFRTPTDDELEHCNEVIELTSEALWDPEYLSGNNFTPGGDHHFYDVSDANVFNTTMHNTTIIEDEMFFEAQENHQVDLRNKNSADTEEFVTPSGDVVPYNGRTNIQMATQSIPTSFSRNTSVSNNPSLTIASNVFTHEDVPSLQSHTASQTDSHILTINGTKVYDNLDQFAYFEIDSDEIKGPKLDIQHMYELEEWIKNTTIRSINYASAKAHEPDWNHWQRYLGWFPMEVIKKTHACTTNYAVAESRGVLRRHRKSRHP